MSVTLNPYLTFRDQAREAMQFYREVFGGQIAQTTFGEFNASDDPAEATKIMHSVLSGEHGLVFMAADTPNSMEHQPGNNMSMSLSGDDETLLTGYFAKLSDGGSDVLPLNKAPWGDIFGMCVDKFGVHWLVNIAAAPPDEA